jgi:predicted nuclease with TOPRIM domain
MWIPKSVLDWFQISKDVVADLREELSATRSERDLLKLQLTTSQSNFSWLTTRVNVLEVERAQLLEKAYGIKTVVPEIVKTSSKNLDFSAALFDDVGDTVAKELGLPVFGTQ